jgi:aspartoacylase
MHQANQIDRVLIVGGTHGNEFTGAYLIKKIKQHPHLVHRSSFETLSLFANPKAFAVNRRYIDKDLNRCFQRQDLRDLTLSSYEELRAKEIDQTFGANGETPVDVIVDLHSTTANMGSTIIIDDHPFNLQLAAYLSFVNPLVNVYNFTQARREPRRLPSLCKFGCTIEVGPVAQGILHADLFQKTAALTEAILDYLEQHNRGELPQFARSLTCYRHVEAIDYPRNECGEVQAMIHPQLQFRDYEPLNPGDPMFLTFDGEAIAYEGTSTVYPVFVNEAAYYEKGIAMCLTQKQQIKL